MYIKAISDGCAHGNPQSIPFDGAIYLPDELLTEYIAAMGFVRLTIEDGMVTALEPDTEAIEAYKASLPPPAPEPPTMDERVAMLEDALCEKDTADAQRMADIEMALCELDMNGGM